MRNGLAQPVDAASVILVRHGEPVGSPWQCFMVRRPVQSEFAADVFVFPGGKVDSADRDPALHALAQDLALPDVESAESRANWLSLKLAAIRELFEESGVLLARTRDGGIVRFSGAEKERYATFRRLVWDRELSMLELARRAALTYLPEALHPFSRWITPETLPRRYDTRFFVALLPAHQEPLRHEVETTAEVWIAPAEALERYHHGGFPLVFATEKHLERMARFRSIEEMIAATAAADLQPVMPRIVERNGRTDFLLPGDEGY